MEFIKLTNLSGDTAYINVSAVNVFFYDASSGHTVIDTGDKDPYIVQESADYIAKHVYVCNKSYVNLSQGE